MKFGQRLETEVLEEFTGCYLSYNELKKVLKRCPAAPRKDKMPAETSLPTEEYDEDARKEASTVFMARFEHVRPPLTPCFQRSLPHPPLVFPSHRRFGRLRRLSQGRNKK
jgi:hypothetical protein